MQEYGQTGNLSLINYIYERNAVMIGFNRVLDDVNANLDCINNIISRIRDIYPNYVEPSGLARIHNAIDLNMERIDILDIV